MAIVLFGAVANLYCYLALPAAQSAIGPDAHLCVAILAAGCWVMGLSDKK